METPLVKRCWRTVSSSRSLLFSAALGVVVCALLAGCGGGMPHVSTTTASAPALLVVRDGPGNFGFHAGDGRIVALDPQNGHLLWQHMPDPLPPGASIVGPLLQPAVQDGLVYVPTSYRDPSRPIAHSDRAELEALDPATGQLRWRHEVLPNQDAGTDFGSVPVVANGVVYLSSTIVMGNGQAQTLRGLVEALDSRSGSVRWSAPLKSAPSRPVVADGHVILLAGPDLVALNASDGSMAWSFAPPGSSFHDLQSGWPPNALYTVADGDPGPLVAQHLVFVDATEADSTGAGIGSTWFAVKTTDGRLAWRSARSAPGATITRPVLNQSGSVLCATSGHGRDSGDVVMGLSTTSGKTLWTVPTSAKLSACAAAGERFYLTESAQDMTAQGMLALSSQTGQRLWYAPATPPATVAGYAPPPQRDGLAALILLGPIPHASGANPVPDSIGIVQLENGNILWRQDIKAAPDLAVTIIGDQVVVPEYSRTSSTPELILVAYALRTGKQAWVYPFGHA